MPAALKRLCDFTLHDLETVRLVLRGGSVIDWHRLNLAGDEQVAAFIRNHELDPTDDGDRRYMSGIQEQAVAYLRRNFTFSIPKPVERATPEQLLLLASGSGHRQQCACTILKVMQIINHTTGRELLFRLPVSDEDLFHLVEEKVYRVVGSMLNGGFPITEFVGGRKNRDSTHTKLLSKPEASTIAIYDKLRFRIVTRSREDLLPILLYMTEQLFPFNYIVPGQSTNTIFHFRTYCQEHGALTQYLDQFQGRLEDDFTRIDNRFSDPGYHTIQFVTEVPVRVPRHLREQAPSGSEHLGPTVYMLCEIQLMDTQTEEANERGAANHDAYKQRQRQAVYRRLRLGARDPVDPKSRETPSSPAPASVPEHPRPPAPPGAERSD